jgi:hypothetical protein
VWLEEVIGTFKLPSCHLKVLAPVYAYPDQIGPSVKFATARLIVVLSVGFMMVEFSSVHR